MEVYSVLTFLFAANLTHLHKKLLFLFFFHLKVEPCEPIEKVLWRVDRSNYVDYFVFSGGLSVDVTGVPPSITFMRGKLKFFYIHI